MDSYIIQVQPQDELTLLIDKLIRTQAERVYLLIPDNSRIAQHVLNFRLLKREADSLKKEIIIVSSSPRVQTLALKSQLQAHQETHELKESASKDLVEPPKPPKLSDIVIPTVPNFTNTKDEIDYSEKIQVKKFLKKEKIHREAKEAKDQSESSFDSKSEKIVDFWAKRPALKLPKFQTKGANRFSSLKFGFSATKVLRSLLFSLIFISLAIIIVTLYFVLPRAKIYIKPVVERVSIDLQITGDINASAVRATSSAGGFILPAQIFEKSLEASRTAAATGEKEVREKARGTITVYNSYSSAPQTLVKTTRFVSEVGKLFRTTGTIVVPGAQIIDGKIVPSSTTVEVIASEPGEEYNVGPSTFSIPGFKGTPKYLAFYGKSEKSMTGGEVGTVRIIKDEDYSKLEKEIRNELEAGIEQSLSVLLPEGFIVPDGAKYVSDIKLISSNSVGGQADEVTLMGTISTRVFAVREGDIDAILASEFESRFPQKRLLEGSGEITYSISEKVFEEGVLKMKVSLFQDAAARIDNLEIAEGVRGKDEVSMRSFLSAYPTIEEARVTLWPFWVNKIPDDLNKIEIIIE